jgi:hypothetical protein
LGGGFIQLAEDGKKSILPRLAGMFGFKVISGQLQGNASAWVWGLISPGIPEQSQFFFQLADAGR